MMSSKRRVAVKGGTARRSKANAKVSRISLPSPTSGGDSLSLLSLGVSKATDKTDPFSDPAKLVLMRAQEAKHKRKQAEVQIALEKIQDRVSYTLNEYEGPKFKTPSEMDATSTSTKAEVNLEVVEDPAYLYELLGDSFMKSKYQQRLTIFIVGYEEKCENREKILTSLQDFFLETEAGGTQNLLDQVEREEINLDDATSGLESALNTAESAAQKLLAIKQEMGKLIAIVAAYPDTKKGRKKMEKALLKAQEEVESLSSTLETVQSELELTKEQTSQLQQHVEVKTQECSKLRKEADKVKLLQVGKEKLTNDLKAAQSEIELLKKELEDTKTLVPTNSEMLVKTTTIAMDRKKIQELESELVQQKEAYQSLLTDKDNLEAEHKLEVEAINDDFEADMEEMRASYEEQLKSLMEDDIFGGEDEGGVITEESDMFALSKEFSGAHVEDSSEALYEELSKQELVRQSSTEPISGGAPPSHESNEDVMEQDGNDTTDPTGELTHPPPPTEDHDTQSNVVSMTIVEAEVPSDTLLTSYTDHPSQTPPGTTSESGSGASTPRRARRESVAGRRRRESVVGRRDSLAGGGRRESSMASTVIDKLKQEFDSREKKLRQELDDIKSKSRKTITSLRAQLAMNQNKENGEMEALNNELERSKVKLENLQDENLTLQEQISTLENEKALQNQSIEELRNELAEQKSLIDQLQRDLEAAREMGASSTQGQSSLIGKEGSLYHMDRSAQWSEAPGQITGELIKMEEVNGLLASGASLKSGHTHLGVPSFPTGGFSPSSLNQSLVSMDPAPLGSPLQSGSLINHPGNTFNMSMLAQSRLSQYGQPEAHLSHDHPVIVEWSKAYENIIKFKDVIVRVLSEHGVYGPPLDDLLQLELTSLDRSQDVQGQMTEMRFSLSLMLHQLEQSLAEVLDQLTSVGVEAIARPHVGEGVSGVGGDELKVTVARLKKKLQHNEETRHIELQESKETIANLSSKVETLKSELAALKRSLALAETDGAGDSVIMFTRLDSERNTRTLKAALEKERISPSTFNKVTSSMQDYLSIPGQRLANLSQQCHHRAVTKRLVDDVHQKYGIESVQGHRVLEGIATREQRKQLEFSVNMDTLGLKRIDLAHSLTHTLTHIEKHAGVFLIKPVFSTKLGSRAHNLITPTSRPLPITKPYSRPHTGTTHKSPSTPHPNMQLVNRLIQSRQQQTRNEGSTDMSGHTSPQHFGRRVHTPHSTRHTSPQHFRSEDDDWYVETSRPASVSGYVNPLLADAGPNLPRMIEWDIRKQRHHEALLGHILPCLHHTTTVHRIPSPTKLTTLQERSPDDKVLVVKSKSKVIPSQSSGLIEPLTMRVQFDFPTGHTHLPPITTPSRTTIVVPQ